ncbi:MAG: hypothetical protein VZS44_00790 [Bacilli bacterium]|nr:hypothetical protein [Bacilli bacterium]
MDNNINIRENKKYLIFDYVDCNSINNLLNDWYVNNKTIIIDKKDDNIVIKLEKDKYAINNQEVPLNNNLNEIIDLFEICDGIRVNIIGDKIRLYCNNHYKNIFDKYFAKIDNYYLFNLDRNEELYRDIAYYNKYFDVINYKEVDEIVNDFSIDKINKCINDELNNIVIVKEKDIKLYIDSDKYYLFIFKDKNMFEKVYLPEIMKYYIYGGNEISRVNIDGQIGNINDNFYLINFNIDDLEGYIKYIKDINDKVNYQLDLEKDYVFVKESVENKYSYSYGYVSILFISFVLSIITIIVVLLNS